MSLCPRSKSRCWFRSCVSSLRVDPTLAHPFSSSVIRCHPETLPFSHPDSEAKLQTAITFAYGLGIRIFFLSADIYRKFYIRFFPALLGLPILSLRNSPGKIIYSSSEVSVRFLKILQIFQRPRLCTENSETWCVSFLCAADQEKNIKKIEKKEKSQKKQRLEQK